MERCDNEIKGVRDMSLKELYSQETIKREFRAEKLFSLLMNNDFLGIQAQLMAVKKNEKMIFQEDDVDYVYYIREGIACIHIEEQIIDFRGAGEFAGLVDSTPMNRNAFHLTPLVDLVVWRFEKNEVIAKIMSTQDGYLFHYNSMIDCYHIYTNRIMLNEESAEERTLVTLQYIGTKFGEKNGDYFVIPIAFTRKLLAAYLGISRTKLSDILKKLRYLGWISIDKKRQIKVYSNKLTSKADL